MSPPKSKGSETDLARRVKVIEGALGIDLDSSSVCSGDPTDCPSDPCVPERCPMHNSVIRRVAADTARILDNTEVLLLAVNEITGLLPLAGLLFDLRKARERRDDIAAAFGLSPNQMIADMMAEANKRIAELEKMVDEMRKSC